MSGFLSEAATPCPSRMNASTFSRNSGRSSSDSLWNDSLDSADDTANVEFMTEIKPSVLTGAKPRRRTKTSTSFMIHDDHEENPTQTTYRPKREPSMAVPTTNRKTSLLAQPAQRFRPRVSFAPSPGKQSRQEGLGHKTQSKTADTETNNELLMQINGRGGQAQAQAKDGLKLGVRRNTVYIPPDDATVASAFMGLFSPLKSENFENCIAEDTQINSLESQIARRRQAKRSLAASAQRAPLRPSLKVAQESCIQVDIPGKNGGKENIPPGSVLADGKKGYQPLKGKEAQNDHLKSQMAGSQPGGIRDTARPAASRPLSVKTSNVVQRNTALGDRRNTKTQPGKIDQNSSMKRSLTSNNSRAAPMRSSNPSRSLKPSTTSTVVPKATALRSNMKSIEKEYPVVSDNIINSALYEDNWLSHQEVAITQLVNELLQCADEEPTFDNHAMLRHELLTLYQGASFTHLHKRLQASLLYGAMSIPKDVLTRSSCLHQDLGMKRKFLDIWVQTYDLRALRAAVEAITGRKIPNSKLAQGSETSDKEKAMKRRLEGFLDAFLLQNQDMDRHEKASAGEDGDAAGRAYRRTVLRSIMIVILLDNARLCPETTVPRRLFLASSPRKSSAAVLQALGRFLLPSCGDIIKILSHLDCELGYEQHPLEEYDYQVDNLAVDLRDGVRLTRIVEVLLYPSTSSGELSSDHRSRLSCYLKFPCMSRTVKLFNVQVALDALASVKGSQRLVGDIRAEDIVDGHREKTIALLWKLVSTWGLAGLVDWGDVRKEVERLKQKAASQDGYENIQDDMHLNEVDEDEPTLLLKQWASVLAHLKGLRLDNFSTSFSDGKVYESIVDEYEGYVVGRPADPSNRPASLESRLRVLGCSAQFAKLVSPASKTHIVDGDFTIGALAFLCSRLLSATKRTRAATVLQTAWRRILARRDQQRRAIARDIARQCAAVVQTRDRMLWAKGVIVQWWQTQVQRRRRRAAATKTRDVRRYR